jgi:carboxyl-terminal processing protease
MLNKKNVSDTSPNYKDLLNDNQNRGNGFSGLIVIVVLLSVLTGLFGYYLGDRGSLRSLFVSRGQQLEGGQELQSYSQEELDKKLSSGSYNFDLYRQIVANLKDKYVDSDKVQDQKLFDGSLKGMVDSIGDKATNYFSAEDYKSYLESFSGQFEGIGVRLEYQSGSVVVMEVIAGSPAEKAGVQIGYVFYKVDGADVSGNSIEEVVAKVRGKSGTTVKVSFIDPSKKEEVLKDITRAAIKVDSMRLVEKNQDTVVFEVSRFTEDELDVWNSKWDKNVNEIVAKGYKNVILDLRGNGGGYLAAAVHAANDFLEPGKLIVTEKSKVRADVPTLSTNKTPKLKGKNVVILINGGTASASEILSGAIKFHNGYKVLGTKSFGKGTVQNTYNLPNGGAVKITTEYWLMPTGKRLDNENPIMPDTEIKQDIEQQKIGKDNVLDEAMKLFN